METGIFIPIILTIVGFIFAVWFFWYYGAFKLPWYVSGILLVTLFVPIAQTFAMLPLDVANCLFGATQLSDENIYTILVTLYWISWFLGWIITPVVCTVYSYNYGFTWKRRIYYAIRYNVWWYIYAAIAIVIAVVLLWVSGMWDLKNIVPVVMALSNAYGLLLLCLLLGYGFVELPRYLWKLADADKYFRMQIFNIKNEASEVAQAIVDTRALSQICERARLNVKNVYRDIFLENLNPRIERINRLLDVNIFKGDNEFFRGVEKSSLIKKMEKINFQSALDNDLEVFLKNTDDILKKLDTTQMFINASADKAEYGLNINNHKAKKYARLIGMRILSIIVALLCMASFWGEVSIMFKPEWSLFNILSHVKMPKWVNELFVTAPIILFLVYVGSWSLTKVHLGNYFRFIKGSTRDTAFYYYVVILCRLAPTIGYHYLMQLKCDKSMTMKVFYRTRDVFFFGDKWTVFSPALMALVAVLVLFNVWDKILHSLGIHKFTFDDSLLKIYNRDVEKGQDILLTIRPSLTPYVSLNPTNDQKSTYVETNTIQSFNW